MRRDADFFGEEELDLIYIAKRLSEAKRVEGVLTAAGVEYAVEPDEYFGGFIFKRVRVGAFFYVRPEAAESSRGVLRGAGYRPHLPEDAPAPRSAS